MSVACWSWNELVFYKENNKYYRSPEDEQDYNMHKKICCQWGTIEEYIQTLYWDPFESYLITQNKFPYKTEPGVSHYLLWVRHGIILGDDAVSWILSERFLEREIVFWQNVMTRRSIFSVDHYQVFIKILKKHR